MKPYDELDITDLVLSGDSDAIEKLESEIQDRDKAIVELWDAFIDSEGFDFVDKMDLKAFGKYQDFVYKTRAIYGL